MNLIQLLSAEPWVERLGWTLVHFLWQGLLIAALFAAARTFARSSPQRLYVLSCAALASMLAAPVVTYSLLAPAEASAPIPAHAAAPVPNSSSGTTFAAVTRGRHSIDPVWPRRVLPSVVMLWLAGAAVFWIRLAAAWIGAARLRRRFARPAPSQWQQALDRLRARLRVSRRVRLLISGLVDAPAVVGWLRPVVLVPIGALASIPAEHLEALLLHELAHIRRYDYLVNLLQSIAEALLFYHPAVWWISAHIRNERELCCDDLAAAATGDAFRYALALADLESCRPAHAASAMAANGGRLEDRIARLLGQTSPARPTFSAPGAAGAVLLALAASLVFGQSADRPKFEVASVKPTPENMHASASLRPGPGGSLHVENYPTRMLIMRAYHLQDFQIAGGPDWLRDVGFDIEAKGGSSGPRERTMLMLQSLLEERFHLKYHRETRELPVFALTVGRAGSKLPAPKEGGCVKPDGAAPPAPGDTRPPCGRLSVLGGKAGMTARGDDVPMPEFIRTLADLIGRPVLDRTGITSNFDVRLEFAVDDTLAGFSQQWGTVAGHQESMAAMAAEAARNPGAAPNLLTAIQAQLGLKLEATKGPAEVMVIDHIEKPGAN